MANPYSSQQSSQTSIGNFSQQSTLGGGATPPCPVPSKALKGAITKFSARLSGTDLTDFRITKYEQLCQSIIDIQNEQERNVKMMHLGRIKPCLEAMLQFGKTIEVFLNVSDVIAFIWGPMKFLLLTASTFAESFETLLEAYEKIGEQLPLLAEYESLFHDQHMFDVLELMYMDILDFHQQAMKFFSGKRWVRFFRSMWKDFGTKFDGILKSLARHKDLVECRGTLAHYRRYQEDMIELKSSIADLVDKEQAKKMSAVKEWLAVGQQPQQDHDAFSSIRRKYTTTTRWILENELVKKWMGPDVPDTPVLWIHGIPGAGKTVLASAIIDEFKTNLDFKTSFFYCREGDLASGSAVGILKGLADQLLDQYPHMLPPCYTRRILSGEPLLRSLIQAKKVLEELCLTIPKLSIIVDGLDECEPVERKQALESLMDIAAQCNTDVPGKLRLLFVSQNYADIHKALHSSATTGMTPKVVPISDTDNEADISTFTRYWVDRIADKFHPFTDDMKEYLRNLTVANAKGMFLYANLVLQNLYAQPTREELLEAIKTENFPDGLKAAYERILQRIKKTSCSQEWTKAQKLLGWMVCAKRRLTWNEIQVALSIDVEYQTIEWDDRRLRKHIHEICGSLVLLSGDRVSLVHSTAKTFIVDVIEDINEPTIECELATLCLQYLTFPCFDCDEPVDQKELRQLALEGHFAFQDYAVAKWFHHVNAWVNCGSKFLEEATDRTTHLEAISTAIDDFMARYSETDWEKGLVQDCKATCKVFEDYPFYDNLVLLTSHIYTFQKKGFEARHKISINDLAKALDRNRKVLEELPKTLQRSELERYCNFYDKERWFKCTRITCRYFSEGFKDVKARKRHVNIHDRPFQCEVLDCLGGEGFANPKDLEKHTRAFHPELSDLAEKFNSVTTKRGKADHACTICGKTFTRNFHRTHHEMSHRGLRPHECSECGKAFTRKNDLVRHQKLHERG